MPSPSSFINRFAFISEFAKHSLKGPRSITFPDDPDGSERWLEPVLRMKSIFSAGSKQESLLLFTVPNCIQHDETSPVIVRHLTWNALADREGCRIKELGEPSVSMSYRRVLIPDALSVDEMLRQLDKSLSLMPFPVEGLDLHGPSGFKHLPTDAVIHSGGVQCTLSRTTRFHSIETSWTRVSPPSELDLAWQTLWDSLLEMSMSPQTVAVEVIEKYDIEPQAYAKIVA